MIILNIFKNKHLSRFSKNFYLSFPKTILEEKKRRNLLDHKGFKRYFGFKTPQTCVFHSSVEHKQNIELYPKKMLSFFENLSNQTSFYKPVNFFSFKAKNSSIGFNDILIADTFSRKKRKTNMQIRALEKITCSYTGKGLILSPTELSIPMCALTFLSGQSCTIVWAGKSVSSWKLRKNSVIGCKVTLRRKSALVFLDKFYVYGREGLLEKKNNFLNNLPFYFGVSKNNIFIEYKKSDRLSSSFSGFSISIN